MMTGKIVLSHSFNPDASADNSTVPIHDVHFSPDTPLPHYSPIEVATAVTFMVALMQVNKRYRIELILLYKSSPHDSQICYCFYMF